MILFFSGSDAYRLRSAATEAAVSWRNQHTDGVTCTLDASIIEDRESLERILKYPSLIPQHTLVILRNVCADAATAEAIQELFEPSHLSDSPEMMVVACDEHNARRESAATKALTTYLKKHAQSFASFDPLTGTEQARWIANFCAQRGTTILPAAVGPLVHRTVGDSWMLANELEKLCAFSQSQPIDRGAIDALVPPRTERDEWQLSNAVMTGNKRAALVALWERLQAGAPVPLLLGGLAYATRTLLTRKASPYDHATLVRAHQTLANLDRISKSGLADGEDGLFAAILNL